MSKILESKSQQSGDRQGWLTLWASFFFFFDIDRWTTEEQMSKISIELSSIHSRGVQPRDGGNENQLLDKTQ